MKLLFVCGCLQPGHDGVGDYTRKLALQLIKSGHNVSIASLNEPSIKEVIRICDKTKLNQLTELRLPGFFPLKKRFTYLQQYIEQYNPELLSIQFVPFSFHPKGLSFKLNMLLHKLGNGRKWHIMFHELWVGMAKADALKIRLWSRVQQYLIEDLVKKLAPVLIHTQCNLYFQQLNRIGISAVMLGLFSNIEVFATTPIPTEISEKITIDATTTRFVFFGGLHPFSRVNDFIVKLESLSAAGNCNYEIIYVGRNGDGLKEHLQLMKQYNVKFTIYGEQDPAVVSYLLSNSHFGVVTGSPQVIDKSGSVAAMLSHQLPVISIGRDAPLTHEILLNTPPGIYFIEDLDRILLNHPNINFTNSVSRIADQFISDIQHSLYTTTVMPQKISIV